MKRIGVFILAAVVAFAMLPAVHADLRIQSISSGLFSFNGPTAVSYSDSSYNGYFNKGYDSMYIGAQSRTGGISGGLAFDRPRTVQTHRFQNPNFNYRTVEYGNWQLQQAHASWPDQKSAFTINRYRDQYRLAGQLNGGTNNMYGQASAFARQYNVPRQYSYPSNYGYTSTRSAYTQGSIYY